MKQSGNPLGWFLSQVWDRWRDRPFWASQQALRHVAERSDVVLYLVSAAEEPAAAAYVASEMELLAWVGKPVIVLLNQLGVPRESRARGRPRCERWREHLAPWRAGGRGAAAGCLCALLGAGTGAAAGHRRLPAGRAPRADAAPDAGLAGAAAGPVRSLARRAGAEHGAPWRRAPGTGRRRRAALEAAQPGFGARPGCQRTKPDRAGTSRAGGAARRRAARQHHAADRAARPGRPGAGRDPGAAGHALPAAPAHGREQGGAAGWRAHRCAGRPEGRRGHRRPDAGWRPARRRAARGAGRRRAGALREPGARHRALLAGLERRGAGHHARSRAAALSGGGAFRPRARRVGAVPRRRRTGRRWSKHRCRPRPRRWPRCGKAATPATTMAPWSRRWRHSCGRSSTARCARCLHSCIRGSPVPRSEGSQAFCSTAGR